MRLLFNVTMAASGSMNKAYSEEDLTNIDKAQFALDTKIKQQPLDNKEERIDVKGRSHDTQSTSIPYIKEMQYENRLHTLNDCKDKFR